MQVKAGSPDENKGLRKKEVGVSPASSKEMGETIISYVSHRN